ncbi:MAG: sulfite exporter TauE/SafE family protein [Chitinophagales bacterium]
MEFLIAAISLGFLGSFHCIGMCGPIALALPLNRESRFTALLSGLLYNAGRIFTYGIFGLLFGLLGKGFILSGYQQALSITLGVSILVLMIAPKLMNKQLNMLGFVYQAVAKLKKGLHVLFSQKSYSAMFSIGVLNGLLPCGLVYLGVAGAIATGDAWNGSLFMMTFGLGTLPAMLFVSMASQMISIDVRNKIRKTVPVFVTMMALVLILRGMNLGIPYISPELSKTDCTKHTCCHKK